jgi:ubiquinone/menaquinone biosynthesis C-methylase UbiE
MALERVLEPEVMDSIEEALTYDAMDHAEVNRQFVSDLVEAGFVSGDILDLGTGTALIPVELCQQMSDIRVMAVDLSDGMLTVARNNIGLANFTERIQLDRVDAKSLPYAANMFDCVISNSIIHHLPEPLTALREAVRVTRGGGTLFFRDLLRPANDSVVAQLVDTYTVGESDHARQLFADSLRAALTLDEVQRMVVAVGFEAESVQATSDRHWTWVGRVAK